MSCHAPVTWWHSGASPPGLVTSSYMLEDPDELSLPLRQKMVHISSPPPLHSTEVQEEDNREVAHIQTDCDNPDLDHIGAVPALTEFAAVVGIVLD